MRAPLAACVVAPLAPYPVATPVAVAPPLPPGEVIGVAPGPGYFWVGGYWNWVGASYTWNPGHWQAYRPGNRWVPHQWVHRRNASYLHPGHWQPH